MDGGRAHSTDRQCLDYYFVDEPTPQTGSAWTIIFSVFFVLGLLEQEKHVLTSLFFLSCVFNTILPFLPKQTDSGP